MPHINPTGVDLVVTAFVVHPTEPKVLLVHHKKLGLWLGPGGHVEPRETTDEALVRELKEETGLVIGETAFVLESAEDHIRKTRWDAFDPAETNNTRMLYQPVAVEVHDFPPLPGHRHLALVYVLKAKTDKVVLEDAHHEIRWFYDGDLDALPAGTLLPSIRAYVRHALWKDRWGAAIDFARLASCR